MSETKAERKTRLRAEARAHREAAQITGSSAQASPTQVSAFKEIIDSQAMWGIFGLGSGIMITALFQYAPKALVLWVAWPCFVFVGWFALIKLRHWELTIFWAALTLGGAMWVVGKIPLAVEDVIGIGRGIVIRVGTEDEPRGTAFWLERGAVAATCADAFPGGKVGDGVVGYESRPVSIGGVLGGRGFASLQGDGLLQIVFINSQIAILKIVPGRETILAGTEWSFGAKRMKLSEATLDMYDVPAGSDVVLVGHDDNTDPSQFSSRE